ncbi:hypothetical protein Q2T46_10695 [Thermoanaerobacterium sp. CMT5567-10]|uniref:hypothetical protein n=1 Tax=Thermoanaerobacterium sp. CMT5567-10 TaxID=3061989 RepID=UPI0026E0EA22|nr:hypothetical protein [Thermoanaerobacterium sp. CMT5567-10]WKV08011.1 hypothetical protein Q2T46_10695 [Thermoanaerobacterium sp. CMT5567-10]
MRKSDWVYISLLLITMNMSEWSRTISDNNFYTFRTVKLFGISLTVLFTILLFNYKFIFLKRKFDIFRNTIFKVFSLIFLVGLVVGFLNLIFGDTNIKGFESDLYYWIIVILAFYISYNFKNKDLIENILIISLLTRPLIILLGWFFKFGEGNYGGVFISSFDPIDIFIPFILSLFFLKNDIPKWLFMISFLSSLITLVLQPSGKSILLLPIGILLIYITSNKSYKNFIRHTVVFIFILILILTIMSMGFTSNNILFKIKFSQATSLLSLVPDVINNPDNVYKMEGSPRDRILEFLNIIEDLKNSYNIVIGKGFGGSFRDYKYPIPFVRNGYSQDQWLNRQFYDVHESINYVFLKFGILGIMFYIIFILYLLKRIFCEKNWKRKFLSIVLIFEFGLMLGYSLKLAFMFGTLLGIILDKNIWSESNEKSFVYCTTQH